MKYLMLLAAFGFGFAYTSCAQNKHTPPASVQTAFKVKFPAVQKAKWELEHEGEWEAEFKSGGHEMSVNFNADGTWLETETEIKVSSLPQVIKDALAAQFAGYKTEEANLVETPGQPTAYEVELEKDEATIEALFAADGKLLKQQTENEHDDDKE